jgi:hypothetical protein
MIETVPALLFQDTPQSQYRSWFELTGLSFPGLGTAAAIVFTIFAYRLLRSWLDARERARAQNVRLLEEALKNPAVDRATLDRLTDRLAGSSRAPQPAASGPSRWLMVSLLAAGWVTLFVGLSFWISGDKDGLVGVYTGLALLTFPFAVQELDRRLAQH